MEPGLYDDLLTSALERELERLLHARAETERIHDAEAADRFAFHLSSALRRALESQPPRGRAELASRVVSTLLRHLEEQVDGYRSEPDLPRGPTLLRAIAPTLPDGSTAEVPRPLTPLLDTTVLTNSKQDLNLGAHLASEIRSAVAVDAIVAFIRRPGVRPVLPDLRRTTERGGRVRVLTTSFTGFTEAKALQMLADAGAEIRVSYDTTSSRLHAKAWIFHRRAGAATALVGSSNFTAHAMETGMEWNVRLSGRRNPEAVSKMMKLFDAYWDSGDFVPFDEREFADRTAQPGTAYAVQLFEIRPHPFQERMLEQLRVAREQGHHRNLLVSATGTGKTVMAALDYRGLRPASLLFVAHRKEILEQSLRTFRTVLLDPTFGELWVGEHRPRRFQHVFASIQALQHAQLEPDRFDVVIVDEFHHAAAATYRRLLQTLRPRELLGLTATPERADGLDVLHWFDGRIAAEMRLWDAIAEGRLAPFQYLGLHDGVSLVEVPWRRGQGYDVAALENVYTSDRAWAHLVIKQTRQQVDTSRMRALGFCVSVGHARFMAERFNAAGIPAAAVCATTPAADRAKALAALQRGELNAVFSVDLFNEGVDIPAIDTLLLLRPTESATLFLQQLGRGLRKTPDKEVCTVLDFVALHRREFRFDLRLRALLGGGTRADLERNVREGFPNLPPGCSATFDEIASEVVLRSLREALPSRKPQLVAELRGMAGPHTLRRFLEHSGVDLETVYANNGCFTALLEGAGLPVTAPGPHETLMRRAVGRLLHIDDSERLRTYRRLLTQLPADLPERELRLWRMLLVQLLASVPDKPDETAAATALLRQHPAVRSELLDLFEELADRIDHEHPALFGAGDCPLRVHARYTRPEIQAALGEGSGARVPDWREGVRWLARPGVDLLLVTIDKTSGFSPTTAYRDYAISRDLFHWESQSTTSEDSATGRRYREGTSRPLLFVRQHQDDRAFWFLGETQYVSHTGSRPMAITWRLSHPIPADLYPDFAAVGAA